VARTEEEKKIADREKRNKWKNSHLEQDREYKRKSRKLHPEPSRKSANKYYWDHRDEIREARRKHREEHIEQYRERDNKYRKDHPEETRESRRKYREAHPGLNRIRQYGMTLGEHEQRLIEQNGVCAICGGNRSKQVLCIDHDHQTNNVRGLLCRKCNTMLGMAEDNTEWLRKAADYLESHI
jgi:hypothetical protein